MAKSRMNVCWLTVHTCFLSGKEVVPCYAACTSPNDSSPEECPVRLDVQQEVEEKVSVNPAQVTQVAYILLVMNTELFGCHVDCTCIA